MIKASLDPLFHPRSVAVIGASEDPTRIGGRPLRYLIESGYAGPIYPVNPRRDTVQGLPAFADIASTPGEVDVAVVAVPAAGVLDTLEACGEHGVRAVVLFTSGFAETGDDGARAQERIAEIAERHRMRVLGPNCLGIYNAELGFYGTFTTTFDKGFPKPGPVAIVSQSGAFGSHLGLLARMRRIEVGLWVTTGNECDVSVPECITWMAARPEVKVIAAYAEGIKDGDALLEACEAVRANGKVLVLTKVGRSEAGSQAAQSHTAALAGSDAVFDAVLEQYGVMRAHDTEEMLDATYAASFGILPRSRRTGALTISGGAGVLMADAGSEFGLDLAPMPEDAQAELKAVIPFASARNPVDITAQVFNQTDAVDAFVETMFDRGDYAAVVAFFTYVASVGFMIDPIRDAMRRARSKHPDRLMILSMLGSDEIAAGYEAEGVPIFDDPVRAMRAVASLARVREGLERPSPHAVDDVPPGETMGVGVLDEAQAKRLLATWGIRSAPERTAADASAAAAAAEAIGYPVAVKLLSPDIAHKSEVGGVKLGISTADAAADAHRAIVESAGAYDPAAELRGTLVSKMVSGGVEVILGVQRDPTFGPVVMLGLGGILTEVLGDVAFRRAPIDAAEAHRMVDQLKGAAILRGARGRPPCDVDALCAATAALSRFADAHRESVETVDINPLMVMAQGEGVYALDALVIGRSRTS